MLSISAPQFARSLVRQFKVIRYTFWRWLMIVFSIPGKSSFVTNFFRIIEADETYQREPRKGSREWVRYFVNPESVPQLPRSRWEDPTMQGLKMMRVLLK